MRCHKHERGHHIELLSDRAEAILVDEGLPRHHTELRSPPVHKGGGFTVEEDAAHRAARSQVTGRPQHGGNPGQHRGIARDEHQELEVSPLRHSLSREPCSFGE